MLSKALERALNESFKQARARRHEFITVEHLLLALLDDSAAQAVLRACSADIDALRGDVSEFIDATTPLVPGEDEVDTQPTSGRQRVFVNFSKRGFQVRRYDYLKNQCGTCTRHANHFFFPHEMFLQFLYTQSTEA